MVRGRTPGADGEVTLAGDPGGTAPTFGSGGRDPAS